MISSEKRFEATDFYRRGYRINQELGSGSSGAVFMVQKREHSGDVIQRVVKHIHHQGSCDNLLITRFGGDRNRAIEHIKNNIQSLTREISILVHVRGHANIASYVESEVLVEDTADGCIADIWILKEYYDAVLSNLLQLSNLSLLDRIRFMAQVASALEYLHSKEIVHRDIKPANILVDTKLKIAKLDDFGHSKVTRPGITHSVNIGTPLYSAPEVDANLPHYDGKLADIFSLGAVFFECVSGKAPFAEGIVNQSMTEDEIFARILANKTQPNRSFDFLNDRFFDVVYFGTAPKPQDRYPDISSMLRAIKNLLVPETYNKEAEELFSEYARSKDLHLLRRAMDNLLVCLEIDPSYKKAWLNRGNLHSLIGQKDEARRCYEEALRIDPSYEPAFENLQTL